MLPLLTLRRSAYQGVTLRRLATTVRVIVREEIPSAYPGAVIAVRPGYARNYLIPQKKAVYATRQNFALLGMKDPDHETAAEKQERLAREALEKDDQDLMAADLLRHYLRNKVLKIWRNVDSITGAVSPGLVDAKAVRQKLSKQLKIDLEPHEKVHLRADPLVHAVTVEEAEQLLQEVATDEACNAQIRQRGEYLAVISLSGGHTVPLKFEVLKR